MKNQILFSGILLALCACGNRTGNEQAEGKQFSLDGEYITVAKSSPVLQAIQIEPVESAEYQASVTTSGTVHAIPSRYAEIASPFAGRILKSYVHLGQKVAVGAPVFEISSPSFFEAGKVYYQSKQEMDLALKNLNRERDLLANRVGVAKALEEAEVNYELKKKDFEQAQAALAVFQIDPDDPTPGGGPLIIRSPISGEVVIDKILIGQYIREDANALAIVADLAKVWVSAHVMEKDIRFMDNIAHIDINFTAFPDKSYVGTIVHVGDMLEEDTRSTEVFIECDNSDLKLKHLMYATVTFTSEPSKAFRVPRSAVLQDEDGRYLVVSEGDNRFRKALITVAPNDKSDSVVVLTGVQSGESIVTKGAFYFIDAR
ncbi:cation efflux system protein [Bacteroidia bacterium]|nr:cation efflux system protein [Bacteroidia bacterium]